MNANSGIMPTVTKGLSKYFIFGNDRAVLSCNAAFERLKPLCKMQIATNYLTIGNAAE